MNGTLAIILLIIFFLFLIAGILLIVMKHKINMNQTTILIIGIVIIVISSIAILAIIFMWIAAKRNKKVKVVEIDRIVPVQQSPRKIPVTTEITTQNVSGITPLQPERLIPITTMPDTSVIHEIRLD
jgi:hypothetical protein